MSTAKRTTTGRPGGAKKAAVKKTAASRNLSLREQLAAKRSRRTSIRFPIGEEGTQAERTFGEAQQGLQMARLLASKQPGVDVAGAERRLADADARLDECALTLTFRGLSPDEVDALQSAFIGADEDAKLDLRGFTCALLAAAVEDSDLTAEDWEEELYQSGRWSKGEVDAICEAAQSAWSNAPAPGIPKG